MRILLLWVGDGAVSSHIGFCGLVVAEANEEETDCATEDL